MTPSERRRELEEALREHHPCDNGLHVCGFTRDDTPLTLVNHAITSEAAALALWERARSELGEQAEADVLVDLMVDGNIHDNFWMRRQMLNRLALLVEAAND